MQRLIQWMGSKDAWRCSRFSDLPQLKHDQRSAAHHWCVVAGGIALILSRSTEAQRSAHLRATQALYEVLREALRHERRPRADAALVGDVMREVAELADPMTQASLGECLHEATPWPAFSRLVAAARMSGNSRTHGNSRAASGLPYSLVYASRSM